MEATAGALSAAAVFVGAMAARLPLGPGITAVQLGGERSPLRLYHLHMPWAIPAALVDTVTLAYPSRRYRSALFGIAVHSAQTAYLLPLVLALVLA